MLIIFASATARNVEYLSNWAFQESIPMQKKKATEERLWFLIK